MCDNLISYIKSTIDELGKHAIQTTDSNNLIDIELMRNRSSSINELLKLKQFLNEATSVLNTKIDKAKEMQAADIKKIDDVMNNLTNTLSWKNKLLTNLPDVGKNNVNVGSQLQQQSVDTNITINTVKTDIPPAQVWGKSNNTPTILLRNTTPPPAIPQSPTIASALCGKLDIKVPPGLVPPAHANIPFINTPHIPQSTHQIPHYPPYLPPMVKIYFNADVYLDAIVVDSIQSVIDRGVLYYITPIDHFAMVINSEIFHGNIGKIYNNQKNPMRVKACKFEQNCNRIETCTYYHDPLIFPGRKEIRNYAANSWTYIEPDATLRDPTRIRRFGSRDNLSTDLAGITKEEIDRFNDQMFHDMLCMLVLRKYKK